MRMQIATISTQNLLAHMEVAFVAGFVDVPEGWPEALDERVVDLNVSVSDSGTPSTVAPVRLRHISEAAPPEVVRELSYSDIDRFVTAPFSRTIPSERSNAEVFFRLTDLRSGYNGGGVLAFAGNLCVEDVRVLDCDSIHELASDGDDALRWVGRVGRDVRRHFGDPTMIARMYRRSLGKAFDQAVWGFGIEPMALGTTTPLAFSRRCERYQDLFLKDDRSHGEELELEELRELMVATGMTTLDRAPSTAAALSRFRQSPDYVSPFAPRTRAQQASLMIHFAASWEEEPSSRPAP